MQTSPAAIPTIPTSPEADQQLRAFAHHLAETQTLGQVRLEKADLLKDLKVWELALRQANALFKTLPAQDAPVSRAGEWMLDNFYLVKQTLRQIEEDLPANFLSQLPTLVTLPVLGEQTRASRPMKHGHTRIFVLAREWIGYSRGQLELSQAAAFVQFYQQVTPLTIGELWALPIMFRIGILERLVYATAELTGLEPPHKPLPLTVTPPANDSLVANCFLSLRLLVATDWQTFFEQTSRVEQILRAEPAGIYARMDFATRNSYRSVVEELARHSTANEEQVALTAVDLARAATAKAPGREAHVGFYLGIRGGKSSKRP